MMNTDPDIDHTKNPFTQGNIFDVNARRPVNQNTNFSERLKISEMLGNKEAEELQAEELQAEELQAEIKNEQRIATEKMRKKLHSNKNKEDRIQEIRKIREKQQEKDELHTIKEVDVHNNDEEWLYKDKNTYYNVGKFIKKHNFNNSGVYYPNNDGFYSYSHHLVFYKFEKATFLETELIGRFFVENKPGRNRYIINFPENTFNGRNIDLQYKIDYVKDVKHHMRTAIIQYLNTKPRLNRNIGQSIPSSIRGYAGDEDEHYSDNVWTSPIEEYINFYKQIIPMFQRKLEDTTGNGRIDNAVNNLERLEDRVKRSVSGFTIEKYMTGEYIDIIRQLLSPVVAAPEVRLHEAQVIPTAALSASAAPPASAWGMPSVFTNTASNLGDAAISAASNLGSAASRGVNYLGSSAANALRFGTGFHQDSNGMVFAQGPPSPPHDKPYLQPSYIYVEPEHANMRYRQSEIKDFVNNPHNHGTRTFNPKSDEDLWHAAEQRVGERKAEAAAANKKQLFPFGGLSFGGKRKSKRKQRRSRKQKKSRKQRR